MPPLYITISQRIIRRRLHMAQIGVAEVRDVVRRLALSAHTATETSDDTVIREELEAATGASIAKLAAIAETWT